MEEKFNKILDKTWRQYCKYGIKSITMDDIATANGISKKTLYKYVNDKSDLVRKTLIFSFEKFGNCVNEILEKDLNAIDEIFEMHKIFIEIMKFHKPSIIYDLQKYYSTTLDEIRSIKINNMYNIYLKNLKKGKKEKLYREDLDIELLAKLQIAINSSRIECEIFSYKDFLTAEASNSMMIYHLRAICSKKGLEILEEKLRKQKK